MAKCESREPIGRYRINSSAIALFHKDGHHVAGLIPEGAIIKVASEAFDGDKLVNVIWDGKAVMMFSQDLRSRATAVD
jgi:hypothetical protein